MYGVSTIAIPTIACELDHVNWQEVVKLLLDVFGQSEIQVVVYNLESHRVHAMTSDGDVKFYAAVAIERYSAEISFGDKDVETDFRKN